MSGKKEFAKKYVYDKIQEHLEYNHKNETRKRERVRSKVAQRKIASWYAEGEKEYDTKYSI